MSEPGPLVGVRVVVTRPASQAVGLRDALESRGAEVALLPLLEVVAPADPAPLEAALAEVDRFQWVVLTSTNAVDAVRSRLSSALPVGVRLAAIGPATSRRLEGWGRSPDLVAASSRAEGLVEALRGAFRSGDRILLPQAADARPALELGLRDAGADVTRVDAYAKRVPPAARGEAARLFATTVGWVTFTSPSTGLNLHGLFDDEAWRRVRTRIRGASIGPVTSDALRALGIPVRAEAPRPTDDDLATAIAVAATSGTAEEGRR